MKECTSTKLLILIGLCVFFFFFFGHGQCISGEMTRQVLEVKAGQMERQNSEGRVRGIHWMLVQHVHTYVGLNTTVFPTICFLCPAAHCVWIRSQKHTHTHSLKKHKHAPGPPPEKSDNNAITWQHWLLLRLWLIQSLVRVFVSVSRAARSKEFVGARLFNLSKIEPHSPTNPN